MRKSRWVGGLATVVLSIVAGPATAVADTPPDVVSVTVSGDAVVGATLEAVVTATGDPTPTIEYQWARCDPADPKHCEKIRGATADTYTVSDEDVGHALIVRVTATNSSGTDEAKSSTTAAVTEPEPPPPDPSPPPPDPSPPPPDPSPPPPDPSPPPPDPSPPPPDPSPPPAPATAPVAAPTSAAAAEPTAAVPDPVLSTVLPSLSVAPLQASPLTVAAPIGPRFLRPFPVVRVVGYSVIGGAVIELLRVTSRRGTKVDVSCRGSGCPLRRLSLRPGRIRPFERFLASGTAITVRVTRSGYIGKYVRFVVRSGAAPERRDACLLPGRTRPTPCPG